MIGSLSGEMRRQKQREADSDMKEADQIIKRMEMEARSFSPDKSRSMLAKVREYKADLQRIRTDLQSAGAAAPGGAAARAELGLGDDYYQTSSGQRERMLQTTERLGKTGDRIQQGRQQLLETEELGAGILQNLHSQRQTITHARDTLHGADDNIAKSRRILAGMSRRIMTNKVVMFGIIGLLVAAIIIVIYFKIKS
ncbi:hypothetical protein WJX84_005747 [Apatococcus fuscideae]